MKVLDDRGPHRIGVPQGPRWQRVSATVVVSLGVGAFLASLMGIDDAIRLLDAFTRLVNAVVWPGLAAFVLVRFEPDLRKFVANLGEFSVRTPVFEASVKRIQAEAAAAIAAAAISKEGATPETAVRGVKAAADLVAQAVTPSVVRRAGKATVLWVDDRPENNVYERQALEALGVTVVLSMSTEDALAELGKQKFDIIISDMGRPPDQKAGYTLLDNVRGSGDRTPFFIYMGSRALEERAEARRRGAQLCTNRPEELIEHVLSALSP
jgi:CheY-like chemotaxis protein